MKKATIAILAIFGLIIAPSITGMVIAVFSALYLVLVVQDAVKLEFHKHHSDPESELDTRTHISRLLYLEQGTLARYLYDTRPVFEGGNGTEEETVYDFLKLFTGSIVVLLASGFIMSGVGAVTNPPQNNVLAVALVSIICGALLGVGHIIWFKYHEWRLEQDDLQLLTENIEAIMAQPDN